MSFSPGYCAATRKCVKKKKRKKPPGNVSPSGWMTVSPGQTALWAIKTKGFIILIAIPKELSNSQF